MKQSGSSRTGSLLATRRSGIQLSLLLFNFPPKFLSGNTRTIANSVYIGLLSIGPETVSKQFFRRNLKIYPSEKLNCCGFLVSACVLYAIYQILPINREISALPDPSMVVFNPSSDFSWCRLYNEGSGRRSGINKKTLQELRMLTNVTLYFQVTIFIMNQGFQLSKGF